MVRPIEALKQVLELVGHPRHDGCEAVERFTELTGITESGEAINEKMARAFDLMAESRRARTNEEREALEGQARAVWQSG